MTMKFQIFLVFASKIATILILQSAAQLTEKSFGSLSRQSKKARLFAFAISRCCKNIKKTLLKQTEHLEVNSVTMIVTKINVDALKI